MLQYNLNPNYGLVCTVLDRFLPVLICSRISVNSSDLSPVHIKTLHSQKRASLFIYLFITTLPNTDIQYSIISL